MNDSTNYKILGLKPFASEEEIRTAYRKLAKKFHPDANQGDPKAEEKFKKIASAYAALNDFSTKQKFKSAKPETNFWKSYQHPDSQPVAPFSGRDIRMKLHLTLEEASKGGSKPVKYTRDIVCPTCAGYGVISIKKSQCNKCKGSGVFSEKISKTVEFPVGIRPNDEVMIKDAGHLGRSNVPGNLLVSINYKPHKYLDVKDGDLLYKHYLGLNLYIEGGSVTIPTASDTMEIKIPPRFPDGGTMRMSGRGLSSTQSRPSGDLIITIEHCLPLKMSRKERNMVTKLMNMPGFNPLIDDAGLIPKGEE